VLLDPAPSEPSAAEQHRVAWRRAANDKARAATKPRPANTRAGSRPTAH
jgi:hypothetical protein